MAAGEHGPAVRETAHEIHVADARDLRLPDGSVDLVVTRLFTASARRRVPRSDHDRRGRPHLGRHGRPLARLPESRRCCYGSIEEKASRFSAVSYPHRYPHLSTRSAVANRRVSPATSDIGINKYSDSMRDGVELQ